MKMHFPDYNDDWRGYEEVAIGKDRHHTLV